MIQQTELLCCGCPGVPWGAVGAMGSGCDVGCRGMLWVLWVLGSSDTEDTLFVQKGKVLGENHPLCLQSLCLGRWLWGAEEQGS